MKIIFRRSFAKDLKKIRQNAILQEVQEDEAITFVRFLHRRDIYTLLSLNKNEQALP